MLVTRGVLIPPVVFSSSLWVQLADLLGYLSIGFGKSSANPVLPKGSGWDVFGVREMSPVIDMNGLVVTESDGIWAYYGGYPDGTNTGPWQIGLAKSTDNGATWARYSGNPVVTNAGTGWYAAAVAQPTVVKQANGTRVMLATGRNTMGGNDNIGCLTSTDGLTWADQGSKFTLSSFTDGVSAVVEMGVPSMIHRSAGDWLMLCECRTTGVTNGWKIYGATASDPTGTWTTLSSGQPLFSPTGTTWESVGVANPHVIENTKGNYFLIYNGINTFWQVGVAYGSDLTNLTRYSANPVLTKGLSGAWDDQQVEADFVMKEAGTGSLRIYYQGYSVASGAPQVGLAMAF